MEGEFGLQFDSPFAIACISGSKVTSDAASSMISRTALVSFW